MRHAKWMGGFIMVWVLGATGCSSESGGGDVGAPESGGGTAVGGGGGSGGGMAGAGGSPSAGAGGAVAPGAGGSGASGGSGGSGGFAGGACQAFCEAGAQAGCLGNQTKAECVAECALDLQKYSSCQSEAEAFLSCPGTSGTISCTSGKAQFPGCEAQLAAFSVCAACVVDIDDEPCTICRKKNCCAELEALGSAADLQAFTSCVKSCYGPTCLTSCESLYPTAAAAFKKLSACEAAECPASCGKTGTGKNDAVRSWCKAVLGSSCNGGLTQSSCEKDARDYGKFYASAECGDVYWSTLMCAAPKGPVCGTSGAELDPGCQKPLEDCLNKSTSCGWSPGADGSCEKLCYGWQAKCSPVAGSTSMACSCTGGPHQGTTFQVTGTCPSSLVFDAMDKQCAP